MRVSIRVVRGEAGICPAGLPERSCIWVGRIHGYKRLGVASRCATAATIKGTKRIMTR